MTTIEIDEKLRAKIEAEVREKIKEEQKAKRAKKPKKEKVLKQQATWEDVWKIAVWERTYDHLEKDPRYDDWITQLEKAKKLYVDFETHTTLAVKPWEIVEQEMKALNFKNMKGVYNNIHIEITGKDMKGENKKDKGYALDPKKSKIRLIQLGDEQDTFVFDTYKMTPEQRERIGIMFRDKFLIGQNIVFECRFICEEWGPTYLPEHVYDTMTIEKLICCSQFAYLGAIRLDLQSIAERRTGIYIAKGYGDSDWGNPNLSEEQIKYAEEDIDILRPIVKKQLPILKNLGNKFVHLERDVDHDLKFLSGLRKIHLPAAIECDVIPCFARMMHKGIPINEDILISERDRRDKLFKEGCEKLGFNINSNPQTLDILVNQHHLNIDSSSSDALAPYYEKYEIVKDIVDLRSVDTINGLIKGYIEAANRYGDKRVHPRFTVYQAYSGRTACKDPNVQQVPREIKPIWMKPPKGKTIINLDYPAIEMRIMAAFCKERTMLDAFLHGKDLHKITAASVNKIPIEQVTKDQRKAAKAVNFGFLYGCSAKRFKQTAMTKYQLDYSIEECSEIRDKFFQQYPDLDRHVRRMFRLFPYGQKDVRMIVKTFFGRKMMVDGSGNALNFSIQGSGADAAKMAIVYFYHKLRHYKEGKYNNGSIEPMSFVHDEIFVEADVKVMKLATRMLKHAMEFSMNYMLGDFFNVQVEPELADFKGDSWKELYTEEELQDFIKDIDSYVFTPWGRKEPIRPA